MNDIAICDGHPRILEAFIMVALKTELLDQKMTEVFDWSDDQTPLRDAMWNHVMDNNGHNTVKTIAEAKKWEKMSDADLKKTAEQMLK